MREVNPNLICTPVFEDLVMRCIAKDPNERFSSMDQVLQALKAAHGVSMTGQLAAVSMSGAYGSMPPPAAMSATPSAMRRLSSMPPPNSITPAQAASIRPALPSASGNQTQMGMLRSGALGTADIDSATFAAPRRSRAWIFVGVLVAAAIGGGLGMIAFRMTAPPVATPSTPSTTPTSTPSATTPATAVAPSTTATSTAPVAPAMLHVTSEPAGASVRDDSGELCTATPCDVALKGDAPRKVSIAKAGYRTEARTVKPGDAPLAVKLARAGGGFHPTPKGTTTADGTQTQPGFKDIPY